MKYFNFDIKIDRGQASGIGDDGGKVYPVSARFSEGGEADGKVHFSYSEEARETASMHIPFNEDALKQLLEQIENALYKRSSEDTRSPAEREQPMQVFGQVLFERVFSGRIRKLFNRVVESLNREHDERVRIRLRIHPSELAALPWEFLYWSDMPGFLCLDRRFSVIRYQELPVLFTPLKVELPLLVFGMVSLPNDKPKLDAVAERNAIKKYMKPTGRGRVRLHWGSDGTWDELRRKMSQSYWHIFHYVGHGEFDEAYKQGMIIAVDKNGRSTPLDAITLSQLLVNPSLRLVVLNTCEGSRSDPSDYFSSIASTLVQRNIPAIVAFQYKVTDAASIKFSQGFYGTIVEKEYIDAAVTEARLAMREIKSMEWGSLVLHMRSRDGILFDLAQTPQHINTPPPAPTPAPPVKRDSLKPMLDPSLSVAESHYDEGKSKSQQGSYSEALDSYQQALTAYQKATRTNEEAATTGKIKVYEAMGDVLDKLKRYKEAEQAYQQADRLRGRKHRRGEGNL